MRSISYFSCGEGFLLRIKPRNFIWVKGRDTNYRIPRSI
jgi:hypothetical protein